MIAEEAREGTPPWEPFPTTVDGPPAQVLANRKWGVLLLGDQLHPLGEYPLQHIGAIESVKERGAAERKDAADEGADHHE